MKRSHEIITVTYSADLACLLYHVLSLKKMWQGDKNFTLVVEDDNTETLTWCEDHVRTILTGWNVKITPPPPEISKMYGWHKQQLLKLWAASISTNDYSVVLDCKNILLRPFSFEENFNNDRLRVQIHGGDAFDENCLLDDRNRMIASCNVLKINPSGIPINFSITPFFWDNSLVRQMLSYIKYQCNYDLYNVDNFIYYESSLYWAYSHNKIKYEPRSEPLQVGQYGGIDENSGLLAEEFSSQLNSALVNSVPIFSIHRFHLTPEKLKVLEKTLADLDIITNSSKWLFRSVFKQYMHNLPNEVKTHLIPKWNRAVQIVPKSEAINFNRIVAYGCSFTAGDELADSKFITSYSIDKINQLKRASKSTKNKFSVPDLPEYNWHLFDSEQRASSWAAKLAEKFNVDFLNKAVSGASLQYTLLQIQQDISDGAITDTDLVLIGLTSNARWMYYDKQNKPITVMFGYDYNWTSTDLKNCMALEVANDYFLLYNYFNCLEHLDLLSKKLNGRILMQYMHHTLSDYIVFAKDMVPSFQKMVSAPNNYDSIIDKDYSFGNFINWETDTHGYYHPREEFHEQFANHIYKKLTNKDE